MRKHVLFLSQYFRPDFGGSTTRSYNAARGLVMNGCTVTVVTAFPHYPNGKIPPIYRGKILRLEEMDGIKLIRTYVPPIAHSSNLKRFVLHSIFILSSLLGLLFVRKVDVVFAMNPNFFSFFPSFIYSLLYGKRIVKNVDDLWPEAFYDLGLVKSKIAKSVLDRISSFTYRKSAAIISVSLGYVNILVNKYHIERERIHVIEHGVDTSIFRPITEEGRERMSMNKNNVIIMYSGAINVCYDFELVFKVAKILERRKEVRFIIRGVGDYTTTVMDMLSRYRSTNVEVFTNMLPMDQLISLLNQADIFVLPMSRQGSIDRGFPTKILEYQALGKPIVCISGGEAARYIKETNSGLVTASSDPHEVASLMTMLDSDKTLAKKLGRNGMKNIEQNLSLEKVGKRLLQVIETVDMQSTAETDDSHLS